MKNVNVFTMEFARGSATPDQLHDEISAVLFEFAKPDRTLSRALRERGFRSSSFRTISLSVSREGTDADPPAVIIAIGVAASDQMIEKAWDDLILPRVRSRLGQDAIGEMRVVSGQEPAV